MTTHLNRGKWGEAIIYDFLIRSGFRILEKNWRLRHLEVDFICMQDKELVIIEVKTRKYKEEYPAEILDYKKKMNLMVAGEAYMKMKGIEKEIRFDLIIVYGESNEIDYYKDIIDLF